MATLKSWLIFPAPQSPQRVAMFQADGKVTSESGSVLQNSVQLSLLLLAAPVTLVKVAGEGERLSQGPSWETLAFIFCEGRMFNLPIHTLEPPTP